MKNAFAVIASVGIPIAILAVIMVCTAYWPRTSDAAVPYTHVREWIPDRDQVNAPVVWVDPETGCQYLIAGGITPRLSRGGHPICRQ
jgi:hypothetical protein